MRIGVIGLGLISQTAHVPNLLRLGRSFVVSHVSDLSPSLMDGVAAGLPGTPRRSQTAADLIADPDLDAVLLLTPGAHAPLAAMALRAGKHVLSEKPLCVSQAEAEHLGRLADDNRRILQVAYMKAYDPGLRAAVDAIERIGTVRLISVEVRHPTHERQIEPLGHSRAMDGDETPIRAAIEAELAESVLAIGNVPAGLERLYLDVLLGSVVHELAALRALGFAPPRQWEHVQAWPFDPYDGHAEPPSIAATAELTDDALLRLQWLWVPGYPRYEETISIIGESGAIHLEMPQPYGPNVPARAVLRGPDGREVELDDGRHRSDSGFLEELRVFHAAVTRGATVPTGADEARLDTASLQAMAASIARSHEIELGGEAAALARAGVAA